MTQLRAIKTFYDNRLGLVTLEDDVLSIVRQVRQLYGERITIEMDPDLGCYHFIEHCEDHTDRLIFTVTELDGRVLDRLLKADSTSRSYEDPYDAAERAQDAEHQAVEDEYRGYLSEAGAHLIHALKKEGKADRLPATVSMYIPAKAEKEIERANHDG